MPANFPSNLQQRLTITASSSIPLGLTAPANSVPQYDCRKQDTCGLVVHSFLTEIECNDNPRSQFIDNTKRYAFLKMERLVTTALYPGGAYADPYFGLCGPDSIDWDGEVSQGSNNGTGRGTANLVITHQPGLALSFTYLDVALLDTYDDMLRNPIYADSGTTSMFQRVQPLDVIRTVQATLIQTLTVQSNEPWLGVSNNQYGQGENPFIIGPPNTASLDYTGDPLKRSIQVFIIVDLSYFLGNNPQGVVLPSGLYKGVLTFTNDQTGNVPEKLVVPFIWQRNPDEGGVPDCQSNRKSTFCTAEFRYTHYGNEFCPSA